METEEDGVNEKTDLNPEEEKDEEQLPIEMKPDNKEIEKAQCVQQEAKSGSKAPQAAPVEDEANKGFEQMEIESEAPEKEQVHKIMHGC